MIEKNILEDKSEVICNHINQNEDSKFILYYKYLTHSDLPTFAKATRINKHEDNLLYYLALEEMLSIEKRTGRPFETAHQSNIGLPKSFWDDLNMNNPRENVNSDNDEQKLINNYADVYLVNDTLKYFESLYTKEVFNKLNKKIKRASEWCYDTSIVDKLNNKTFG